VKVVRLLAVGACLAVAACSGGHRPASTPQPPTSSLAPSTAPAVSPSVAADRTVWLCRPGAADDPCASDLTSTAVLPDGSRREVTAPPTPASSDLDCFYVYPTVSRESTPNADLRIQPAERDVAVAQASRFSSACHVWAPMYRQRTVGDLFNLAHGAADSPQNELALASLRAAWRDYLAHDNHGRKVVLIGHSQGAAMLIRLIRADIDPDPAVRRKIALAILLGGNVTVADGKTVGGSFQHIPLCSSRGQSGCVIAYSSFPKEPPAFSLFGRAGSGVSALAGETATNRQVACVNPAAVGSTAIATLHPYVPTSELPTRLASTPWVDFPGRLRAQCRHAGTATWLEVTPVPGARTSTQLLSDSLGPAWGYHVVDVNLALGDLVDDVAALH
jgi:hypothetical protein